MSPEMEAAAIAYLALQDQIDALEIQAGRLKEQIKAELDGAPIGHSFEYDTCRVQVVRGRKLERITRESMVVAGIAAAQIEKAVIKTEGQPGLRISKKETQ